MSAKVSRPFCRCRSRRFVTPVNIAPSVVLCFRDTLFVTLDLTRHQWRSVNGTHGVVTLIMNGGEPSRVPAGMVESLIEISSDAGVVRFDTNLVPGQKVKILTGPFADFIGTLERLDEQGRVRVLLDMMGGQVPVMSLACELMPA